MWFLRYLYALLPFKRQAFGLLKLIWIPSFYRRLYFEGPFNVNLPGTGGFRMFHHNRYGIETEIFWNGILKAWEVQSLSAWMKLVEKSKCIIDVGSAEGMYALVSKAMNPTATVFAFEPLPTNFEQLKQNVELSGFAIECLQYALSDENGSATIYLPTGSTNTNEASLVERQSGDCGIEVEARTLSWVAEQYRLPPIDLIKIDVEGAEPKVLNGMGDILARDRPAILIESLSAECGIEIEKILKKVAPGYLYYDINDDIRNGPLFIKRVNAIRKATCLNYLLLPYDVAQSCQMCIELGPKHD
jgi:FkbM family methyltransferase